MMSCTTNGNGQCSLTRSRIPTSRSSIAFTVTGVSAPGGYQPSDNHDVDGGSNGTSITVQRP